MAKRSYIEFYYSYDNHERAMASSLLLTHLLNERVDFTALSININADLAPPRILIIPQEGLSSRYHSFELQDPNSLANFKKDCKVMRESSLEKKTDNARGPSELHLTCFGNP